MPSWLRAIFFFLRRIPLLVLLLMLTAVLMLPIYWLSAHPDAVQRLVCFGIVLALLLYLWKQIPGGLRRFIHKVFKTKSKERNKHGH